MSSKHAKMLLVAMLCLGMAVSARALAAPPTSQQKQEQERHRPNKPHFIQRTVAGPEVRTRLIDNRDRVSVRMETHHPRIVAARRRRQTPFPLAAIPSAPRLVLPPLEIRRVSAALCSG